MSGPLITLVIMRDDILEFYLRGNLGHARRLLGGIGERGATKESFKSRMSSVLECDIQSLAHPQ